MLRSCASSTPNVNYRILKSFHCYIKNQFNDLRSDEIWKGFLVCLCTLIEALSISGNQDIHLCIRKLLKKRTLLWTEQTNLVPFQERWPSNVWNSQDKRKFLLMYADAEWLLKDRKGHKIHQKLCLLIEHVMSVLGKERGFRRNRANHKTTLWFLWVSTKIYNITRNNPEEYSKPVKNSTKHQKINKALKLSVNLP